METNRRQRALLTRCDAAKRLETDLAGASLAPSPWNHAITELSRSKGSTLTIDNFVT